MGRLLAIGVLALAANATATPADARTLAEDVAEISTNACFRLASGAITMPHPASPEFEPAVRQLSLSPGITRAMLDRLGPGVNLVSRSAMGHRSNAEWALIFTAQGAIPGCRVLVLGPPTAEAMDAIATALTSPAFGWTAFPELTETRGIATKRVFLRRDDQGAAYMLNLVALSGVPGEMRLYTTTVRIPPNVSLPEGF